MSEIGEGGVVVLPKPPEITPVESIGPHTPLDHLLPAPTAEQRILERLASFDEKETHESKYRTQLDEVRAQARDFVVRMNGRQWKDLSKDLQDEMYELRRSGEKVFEDYFKDSMNTASVEAKKILNFYNPTLSEEDLEKAHDAYDKYKTAKAKLIGSHNDNAKENNEQYHSIMRENKEILNDLGLSATIDTFADSHFAGEFRSILTYEFVKLGFPERNSIRDRIYLLSQFQSKKNTELLREFFDNRIIEQIEQETFEEAMKICFEERDSNVYPAASDYNERVRYAEEPSIAIEFLANYPTPEVIRRLITLDAFSMRSAEKWDRNGRTYQQAWKNKSAMGALLKMKTSTNWDEVVSKMLEAYPEMKGIEPELKELKIYKASYSSESASLRGLESAFRRKYLKPLQLQLVQAPDDLTLGDFINKHHLVISESDLEDMGQLSAEEHRSLLYMPYKLRHSEDLTIQEPLSMLNKKDVTPDERDSAINRLKKIADTAKKIAESGLVEDRDKVSVELLRFWSFVSSPELTQDQTAFLISNYRNVFDTKANRDDFQQKTAVISSSEHYPLLLTYFMDDNPRKFLKIMGKQELKIVFGEKVIDDLLNVLPKETDERRNAFLHNEYDRTSGFFEFLFEQNSRYKNFFTMSKQDFEIATDYIAQFGLSKDANVFHYFKQLTLLERGDISELPPDIAKSGILTRQELLATIERIRIMTYGEKPLTHPSKLTAFELSNLRVVTGKAAHTFDVGRPSFQRMIDDFERDVEFGNIAPVPEGYKTETITLRNTKVEFDATEISDDFLVLAHDIKVSLMSPDDFDVNKIDMKQLLERKIEKIREASNDAEGKKKEFLIQELSKFQTYYNDLDGVDSVDSLMKTVVQMKMDKTERPEMNVILRQLIFKRLFSQNENLKKNLIQVLGVDVESKITPEKILAVVDLIKDPIHEHVINMKGGLEKYWSGETVSVMKANKDSLRGIFEPYYNKLTASVDSFNVTVGEVGSEIRMIPDRGFIGEMSGYLGNVCYTAVYPLLKGREVVPYKFIEKDPGSNSPKFIGSVLVFEVETEGGEPALMIRGFDVPKELNYQIGAFFEAFVDKMVETAKARGKKKILVPGNSGAMSNYNMTIDHIWRTYCSGEKKPITLSQPFLFNGYDLTKNSYVARNIE